MLMSHSKCTCAGPVSLKNVVMSFDEKCISVVLKLQISMSFQGLHPLNPDQGFSLDPLGGGGLKLPKPPAIKLHDLLSLHAKPGNFRKALISSGRWGRLEKQIGMREVDPLRHRPP